MTATCLPKRAAVAYYWVHCSTPLDRCWYSRCEHAYYCAVATFLQEIHIVEPDGVHLARRSHCHIVLCVVLEDCDAIGFDGDQGFPYRIHHLYRACFLAFRCRDVMHAFRYEVNLSESIYLLDHRPRGRVPRHDFQDNFVRDHGEVNKLHLVDTNADDCPSFPFEDGVRLPCHREFAAALPESLDVGDHERHPCFREFSVALVEFVAAPRPCVRCLSRHMAVCLLVTGFCVVTDFYVANGCCVVPEKFYVANGFCVVPEKNCLGGCCSYCACTGEAHIRAKAILVADVSASYCFSFHQNRAGPDCMDLLGAYGSTLFGNQMMASRSTFPYHDRWIRYCSFSLGHNRAGFPSGHPN